MRVMDIWYDHVDVEQFIQGLADPEWQKRWRERIAKERARSVIEPSRRQVDGLYLFKKLSP